MSTMTAMASVTPLGLVGRWATRSQEEARRNAMTACTALAARRLERLEVEEYIAAHLAALAEAEAAVLSDATAATNDSVTPIRHVS